MGSDEIDPWLRGSFPLCPGAVGRVFIENLVEYVVVIFKNGRHVVPELPGLAIEVSAIVDVMPIDDAIEPFAGAVVDRWNQVIVYEVVWIGEVR